MSKYVYPHWLVQTLRCEGISAERAYAIADAVKNFYDKVDRLERPAEALLEAPK